MKRTFKKLGGLLLALCLLLSLLPMTALAVEEPALPISGSHWEMDANGQLTIGTLAGMYDWCSQSSTYPGYKALVKSVVILDDGVTDTSDVVAINGYAFSSCTNLTSVTIPATVMEIGDGAFATCTSLKSVALPDSLQTIGDAAFNGCTGLTSVTIPASVTNIGDSAFSGCKNLVNVILLGGDPSKLTIGSNIFNSSNALNGVYVPAAALSGYKTKTAFSAYASLFYAPSVDITQNGTTIYYPTLSDALEKAKNGDTITLLSNITEEASNAKATQGITVTIDGQGLYKVTGSDSTNSVALTLTGTGTVILKDLTLEGGATSSTSTGLRVGGLISVQSYGTVTIKGGAANSSYGLDNSSAGTVDVTSASATGTTMGIGAANSGPGTVNVSTATGSGAQGIGVANNYIGTINVTTADGTTCGVDNLINGTINVTTATGISFGVYNESTGTVNATTITSSGIAVKNDSNGKVNAGAIGSGTFTTTTNMDVAAVTLNKGTGASCVLDSITVAKTGSTTVGTLPSVVSGGTYSNTWYTDSAKTTAFSGTTVTGATTLYSSFYTVPVTPPSDGGFYGGSSITTNPTTTISGSTATTTVTPTVSGGTASGSVTASQMSDALDKAKAAAGTNGKPDVKIQIDGASGASSVGTTIPQASVQALVSGNAGALTISGPTGTVTFDAAALKTISGAASGDVTVTASKVDASTLSDAAKQTVGSHPVYEFSVTSGGKTISQFGGSVTVSVPYTPAAGEDTNAIVIYYIAADGKLTMVPDARYDAATGTVVFTTTHFSTYAVGYNKMTFTDVSDTAWYASAVTFLAARGITSGTTATSFSPDASLTRGQFITMLLRAYSVSPDSTPTDNFADAGNTYYTNYLAAAKRMGITSGVGDNKFAPDQAITRQEMFTLLYSALKATGKLPQGKSGKTLADFSDATEIASWAKDAMTLLVETGTVSGSSGKLSPTGATTRAEMAQVLYSLLGK